MVFHRFALLFLAAASSAAAAAPLASDAWMRALPGNVPAGGYVTLTNTSAVPIALTGAHSGSCGMVMLHLSHKMNGVAHMMAVESIEVPAHGSAELKPGGYHLMCMQPKNLKPGTSVTVTLQFSDGSNLPVAFAVRSATGK